MKKNTVFVPFSLQACDQARKNLCTGVKPLIKVVVGTLVFWETEIERERERVRERKRERERVRRAGKFIFYSFYMNICSPLAIIKAK